MANFDTEARNDPLILMIPGLHNSGPDHWQSRWEQERDDCVRVELGMWSKPHRNTWVNKLNLAIHKADRPVILVAHSLGCYAVAWWAQLELLEQPAIAHQVVGALLVAPPEVDGLAKENPLSSFAPTPDITLPFDTIVVASHDDHYIPYECARRLAATWGGQFADAGRAGHINADSGLGNWEFGQFLLDQLIQRTSSKPVAARPSRVPQPAAPAQSEGLAA
jgi:predicted alpha/beta hydrolase family esterase